MHKQHNDTDTDTYKHTHINRPSHPMLNKSTNTHTHNTPHYTKFDSNSIVSSFAVN